MRLKQGHLPIQQNFLALTRLPTEISFNVSWELPQKKLPADVTSIIDDLPASRIFLNTWIANFLVTSQTIVQETEESVLLTLTFFGRTCHWRPQLLCLMNYREYCHIHAMLLQSISLDSQSGQCSQKPRLSNRTYFKQSSYFFVPVNCKFCTCNLTF
jgi:hypothetical protein